VSTVDDIVQDALDEERLNRIEEQTEDEECPGSYDPGDGELVHCDDEWDDEEGERFNCVHCECCICPSCFYARVG
jgi:hypothetical protein